MTRSNYDTPQANVFNCKGCARELTFSLSKYDVEAIRHYGATIPTELDLAPDERDFIETGYCPDCEYPFYRVVVDE